MEYLEGLNKEQREAVLAKEGPILVLAGAGSGKTRVVTTRIIHLIHSGFSPREILGLTFTNKAAKEMQERVRQLTDANVLISTFHSLGAKILRESIDRLGYPRFFTIYDEDDVGKILSKCLYENGLDDKKGEVKRYLSLISRAKNALVGPETSETSEFQEEDPLFSKIYQSYNQSLKASGALDFDDLLFLPVKLISENQEARAHYTTLFSHLLIDEYQDTNQAQYRLVKLLSEYKRNVFAVGDPDQAIYSWRGANIKNILHFEEDYEDARIIRLEQNYRSTTHILSAANALIQNNTGRLEKNLWSDKGLGAKIRRYSAYNDREEARFIAAEVKKETLQSGRDPRQIAVFYRTNAQSRVLEDQFLSQKIPYAIIGGVSFYQRREIKDILAYLRLAIRDNDLIAFERVINLPKRGIGASSVEKIIEGAKLEGLSLLHYLEAIVQKVPLKMSLSLSSKARTGIASFLEIVRGIGSQIEQKESIGELIRFAIERTGYRDYLREDLETFEDRMENLDALVAKGREWDEVSGKKELPLFLEELSLKSSQDETSTHLSRVSLMTAHNAKGLEFEVAFLAGLEEELFPHINSKDDEALIEEERRLCYVGMTRAKQILYLTDSQMRFMWGQERFMRPSRFLKEVPQEYLEKCFSRHFT